MCMCQRHSKFIWIVQHVVCGSVTVNYLDSSTCGVCQRHSKFIWIVQHVVCVSVTVNLSGLFYMWYVSASQRENFKKIGCIGDSNHLVIVESTQEFYRFKTERTSAFSYHSLHQLFSSLFLLKGIYW